jgi:O-antigen/teichoic acid export membrane protein
MLQLARNSGTYILAGGLIRAMSLLLAPVYTRVLRPADYGVLAICSTITFLLTIGLGLGVSTAVGRLFFESDSADSRRELYGTALGFLMVVPGLLTLGIELAGSAGYLDVIGAVPYSPYLRFAVWSAYFGVFVDLPLTIYQTRQEPRKVVRFSILNAVLLASLTVLFVVALRQGVVGALRAGLLASAFGAVLSIVLTARMASFRRSVGLLRRMLAFGLPIVPHMGAQWVLAVSDRLLLQRYVSTSQVGLYSLGASVAAVSTLIGEGLNRAFTPAVTAHLKEEGPTKPVVSLGTAWIAIAMWLSTAAAIFGGDLIRILTPPRYHDAAQVVWILVFGNLAFIAYQVAGQGMWFSMRTRSIPAMTACAAIFNVVLNLLLLPRGGGMIAAAWSTFAAYVLLALLQARVAHRLYPIPWELGRWGKLLVAASASFALGHSSGDRLTVVHFVVEAASLLVVFPALLWLLRFPTASERAWLDRRLDRG